MAKVKVKTNRGAVKRFKVTANGKIKRTKGGRSHLNAKKSRRRKRRLLSPDFIEGARAKRIKKIVPYL
ncbi:MAG: 50S ribosomal protein L35 [Thermodesulfobacteriota bacterium]